MQQKAELTTREKIILREISIDSRVSLTKLAKSTNCSIVTVKKFLDKLIEKLDIKFTLEIDMERLGFSDRHILTIKFKRLPDMNLIKALFINDPYAQDVYLTEGDFDLLIFAATDTPINYTLWETKLASDLSNYLVDIRPSEFVFPQLGYVPLNESFVNFIRGELKVDNEDKEILKLLNKNARIGYRELGKTLGLNEDTIRYRIFRLLKKGIIRRFTIAAQNYGDGYILAYVLRYKFYKNTTSNAFSQMRHHYMTENEELPTFNSFQMIAPLSGSYRSFGIVFNENKKKAFDDGVKWHKTLLKQEEIVAKHAFIKKVLKGSLPLRNLDAKENYRFIWK